MSVWKDLKNVLFLSKDWWLLSLIRSCLSRVTADCVNLYLTVPAEHIQIMELCRVLQLGFLISCSINLSCQAG